MNIEDLSPDEAVLWEWGFVHLNYTIVYTWLVISVLLGISWLATRRLTSSPKTSRWQNFLEIVVAAINGQIRDVTRQSPERYLPFIGTLFLFIVVSNLLAVVPGFHAPTASLSAGWMLWKVPVRVSYSRSSTKQSTMSQRVSRPDVSIW